MNNALIELVDAVKNSSEYIEVEEIKKKIETNSDIMDRVNRIKVLQKKYMRENSIEVESELKRLEEELKNIPIYAVYLDKLNIVNSKINYINDSINEYFYDVMNK